MIFAVLLTLLTFVSGGCAGNSYTVCPGGGCNYTSIQAAINASQPGDTIIVRDGTYTENVEVNGANLTLQSENGSAFTTVVAAVNTSDVFLIIANSVTITGFTVRNATSARGIRLLSVHHCTVSGNNASGNYHGIYLYSSSNNYLTNNTANSNNDHGIYLYSASNNNTLSGNTVNSNNGTGIYLGSANNNTLVGNTVNSNNGTGIYLQSSSNNTLAGNIASNNEWGIDLYSSSTNILTENTVSNNSNYGMYLRSSSNNNTLIGNTASNNANRGMYLSSSSNNILTNNTASNNANRGMYLSSSSNNNLTGNTASNNSDRGIYLYSSSNNFLTGNTALHNSEGICLYNSSNNSLSGNTINSNNNYGIVLDSSNDNHIYNNYFDNAVNAYDIGNNIWNITKTIGPNIICGSWLGGNYWSDYSGKDINGDGLGDSMLPYNSSGNIVNGGDYLPLVPGEKTILVAVGASDYSNTLEHDALVSTLAALGYNTIHVTNVTEAQIAEADVIFSYDGGTIFNPVDLDTWISSGKGYIQLGDWTRWFPTFYEVISAGTTITVNITEPSHPVAAGLPASWQGRGYFAYGWEFDVFGWSVGYHEIGTLQAEGYPLYTEGISATTYGSGRAVFFGFNVYGSEAGPNELLLLNNTIKWVCHETFPLRFFDTGEGTYPSISGTFNGTITPSIEVVNITTLYTYPCPGTGGHTEYAVISYSNGTVIAEAYWNGYTGDWHNLTFNNSFTLYGNQTYNYTIHTGSYPQIIHQHEYNATGGVITCEEFVDVNGKRHENWIPAIRLS